MAPGSAGTGQRPWSPLPLPANPLVEAFDKAFWGRECWWEWSDQEWPDVGTDHVLEVVQRVDRLPREQFDTHPEVVWAVAFTYSLAATRMPAHEQLIARAARLLQKLFLTTDSGLPCPHVVMEAAERYPLSSGLERYFVARRLAQDLDPKDELREVALGRQVQMGRDLVAAQGELWQPLGEALVDAACHWEARGDYKRAWDALQEAIGFHPDTQSSLDSWGAVTVVRAHAALARISRVLEEPRNARGYLETVARWSTEAAAGRMSPRDADAIARALADLAHLVEEEGDCCRAKRLLEAALNVTHDRKDLAALQEDLCEVLGRMVREDDGVSGESARAAILRNCGVRMAAAAGHSRAGEAVALDREGLVSAFATAVPVPWWAPSHQRTLQLLNLDRDVVVARVADARQAAEEAGWDLESRPYPDTKAQMRAWTQWRVWRGVQLLGQLAEIVADRDRDRDATGESASVGEFLRCAGFTIEDVDVLQAVLWCAEGLRDIHVTAGPSGQDSVIWPPEGSADGYYDKYEDAGGEVDLVMYQGPFRRPTSSRALGIVLLDIWVADGLSLLFGTLAHGEPDLRRCQMPRGVYRELDYRLGERDAPPPKCNRFFIPTKRHKDTCGHPTCETYHGRLQPLGIKLMQRAEELAARECRADGSLEDFYEMWREASTNRDAKAALARFRRMLKSASKSRNSS